MTSTIKVNTITTESGSTLTVGGCGKTVALASGASQTGFGRTGTVDWQTSIKTAASFTAANGEGYFVDTSSNAVTANLPAGSVGAIVAFKDYAQNFDTNALTIAANGSDKIEGQTFDMTLDVEGIAVTLVFGDATKGWQAVNSNEITNTAKFIAATGGTITTVCTNFKVHTFTGPGTFCVSCAGNSAGSSAVDYLVVAGAGGGGGSYPNYYSGGGGGAGGYRESPGAASGCYSVSPLGTSPAAALPVTATGYPVTIGGGGTGGPSSPKCRGCSGSNSVFAGTTTITSAGGGYGGRAGGDPAQDGTQGGGGGSGGGTGGYTASPQAPGGTGNNPPVNPPQGNPGGAGTVPSSGVGGAGGGATAAGADGSPGHNATGGAGATSSINGTPTTRSVGGNGGAPAGSPAAGGANTGNGGAGGNSPGTQAGAGGSGIVIIRYKFQ